MQYLLHDFLILVERYPRWVSDDCKLQNLTKLKEISILPEGTDNWFLEFLGKQKRLSFIRRCIDLRNWTEEELTTVEKSETKRNDFSIFIEPSCLFAKENSETYLRIEHLRNRFLTDGKSTDLLIPVVNFYKGILVGLNASRYLRCFDLYDEFADLFLIQTCRNLWNLVKPEKDYSFENQEEKLLDLNIKRLKHLGKYK